MSLTAQDIINRADLLIQDLTNVRWSTTELLDWLNDSRRAIAVVRPDIYSVSTMLNLVSGAQQQLPSDGVRLLDVPRNVGGQAITLTQRGYLDQQNPSWHQMTPSTTVFHFMLDERYPSNFWVYPPATTSASVEIIYQQAPSELTLSSTLSIYETAYSGAMVDYVVSRAFSKDAEYAGNLARAAGHYQLFNDALTAGAQTAILVSPNKNNVSAGGRSREAM